MAEQVDIPGFDAQGKYGTKDIVVHILTLVDAVLDDQTDHGGALAKDDTGSKHGSRGAMGQPDVPLNATDEAAKVSCNFFLIA